ncbi:MAG TPA: hypothetical protein EYN67_05860 [Flavobacteriales bacterium]|nr:hypothetical protein [Flavobacteriales bacterium]
MSHIFDNNIIQHNKLAHLHNDKDIFFCKTDYLPQLFNALKNYDTKVTLITGNSDYAITDSLVDSAPACIVRWFGQCINTDHPMVTPLPYGLENSEHCILGEFQGYGHPGGKLKLEVVSNPPIKNPTKDVYANFSLTTYAGRANVSEICKRGVHITYDVEPVCVHRPYIDFVDKIIDHKMVICPRGNAPAETHRFWEVLYLGRVPIVKYKKGLSSFTSLPVIALDDWDNLLDLEFLQTQYEKVKNNNRDMLKMSYWIDLIKNDGKI